MNTTSPFITTEDAIPFGVKKDSESQRIERILEVYRASASQGEALSKVLVRAIEACNRREVVLAILDLEVAMFPMYPSGDEPEGLIAAKEAGVLLAAIG